MKMRWLAMLLVLFLIAPAMALAESAAVDAAVPAAEIKLNGLETDDGAADAAVPAHANKGWQRVGGSWYYYDASGKMLTGWQKINAAWYYFSASGVMQTGWMKSGSTWYYFSASGVMQTGWMKSGSTWYYFSGSGAMKTGWMKSGSAWYYFNGSGAMQTGWMKSGSTWYYFNGSGAMQTGWMKSGSTWYYFNGSGAMKTGWLQMSGNWYYFESGGAMVTGKRTIDGKTYTFDANGVMQTNQITPAKPMELIDYLISINGPQKLIMKFKSQMKRESGWVYSVDIGNEIHNREIQVMDHAYCYDIYINAASNGKYSLEGVTTNTSVSTAISTLNSRGWVCESRSAYDDIEYIFVKTFNGVENHISLHSKDDKRIFKINGYRDYAEGEDFTGESRY